MVNACPKQHGMFGETKTVDVIRMDVTGKRTLVIVISTCAQSLGLMAVLRNITMGMLSTLTTVEVWEVQRRTKLSRTCKAQEQLLLQHSGLDGCPMMVLAEVAVDLEVRPLL